MRGRNRVNRNLSPNRFRRRIFQLRRSSRSDFRLCSRKDTISLMYSPAVLDHFKNPRNTGDLPDATAIVEVSNPVCGDVLRLAARIEKSSIAECRFKAQGCVTSVACASILTELLAGRSLDDATHITAMEIANRLGGLEQATFHAAQLAADALIALLAKLPS